MANVLLESLACGTPVVATAVSGNPEAVADPVAGVLIGERSAAGVRQLEQAEPAREQVRAYAQRISWEQSTRGQSDLFSRAVADRRK